MFRSVSPAILELPEADRDDLATAPCLPARFEVVYSRDVAVKKKLEAPWTQRHPNLVWFLPIVISVVVYLGMGFFHLGSHYLTLTVESEIDNRTQSLGTQIGQLSDRVSKIEGQLQILIEQQMKNSASLNRSDFKAAVPALRSVAAAATAAHINIDPQIVDKAGNRILEIASAEPGNSTVWDAATAFLNYRSFLNYTAAPAPEPVYPIEAKLLQGFSIQIVPEEPGRHHPWHLIFQVLAGGRNVSPKHAAVISKLPPIKGTGTAEWLILEGHDPDFGVKLDGEYMKNVIVENMRVHYDGGPLLLRNVFFVNCAFSLRRTPASARLAKSLLASAATDFSSRPTDALQGWEERGSADLLFKSAAFRILRLNQRYPQAAALVLPSSEKSRS